MSISKHSGLPIFVTMNGATKNNHRDDLNEFDQDALKNKSESGRNTPARWGGGDVHV